MATQAVQAVQVAQTASGAKAVGARQKVAERGHFLRWIGYASLSGWLAGPLLAAGYWLVSGAADDGRLSFGTTSELLPFGGLLVVWAAFVWTTRVTLATGWRGTVGRATAVLVFGSVGWVIAWLWIPITAGGSINMLVLEWAGLTLPYPAAALAAAVPAIVNLPAQPAQPAPHPVPGARRPLPLPPPDPARTQPRSRASASDLAL